MYTLLLIGYNRRTAKTGYRITLKQLYHAAGDLSNVFLSFPRILRSLMKTSMNLMSLKQR